MYVCMFVSVFSLSLYFSLFQCERNELKGLARRNYFVTISHLIPINILPVYNGSDSVCVSVCARDLKHFYSFDFDQW